MLPVSQRLTLRLQAFSSTPRAQSDVAKLILVGRLGKNPEVRMTRSDKEYISYVRFLCSFRPEITASS